MLEWQTDLPRAGRLGCPWLAGSRWVPRWHCHDPFQRHKHPRAMQMSRKEPADSAQLAYSQPNVTLQGEQSPVPRC